MGKNRWTPIIRRPGYPVAGYQFRLYNRQKEKRRECWPFQRYALIKVIEKYSYYKNEKLLSLAVRSWKINSIGNLSSKLGSSCEQVQTFEQRRIIQSRTWEMHYTSVKLYFWIKVFSLLSCCYQYKRHNWRTFVIICEIKYIKFIML